MLEVGREDDVSRMYGRETMRIQDTDVSINIRGLTQKQGEASATDKRKNGSFFAGNLNQTKNPIEEKRKEAQEKALKIVGDTFTNEKKVDDDLQERADKIKELEDSNMDALNELKKIDASKEELKETYGITEDSQEQKELELLEKRRDLWKQGSYTTLTEEEKERLRQIDEAGMTEYQQRSMDLDKSGDEYRKTIRVNDAHILEENAIIRNVKLERLKSSPMVKATKAADEIMDAASDEIKGMLMQEAKEHVEEVQEEEQKKAEEKAEKEAEEEKKIASVKKDKLENEEMIAKIKENMEDSSQAVNRDHSVQDTETSASPATQTGDALTKQIVQSDSETKDIQKELKDIMNKMKLLEEDLKGTTVDENI